MPTVRSGSLPRVEGYGLLGKDGCADDDAMAGKLVLLSDWGVLAVGRGCGSDVWAGVYAL